MFRLPQVKVMPPVSVLGWLFILLGIASTFFPNFSPDFGWHWATGKFIWANKEFVYQDLFSYSLPGSVYIAHSWLTDVILFHIYNWWGHNGITTWYGLLISISLWLVTYRPKASRLNQILALLSALAVIPFVLIGIGLRTQVVSFLGLALLWRMMVRDQDTKITLPTRYTWLLPLVFLVWANTHGGFVLGLGLVAAFFLFQLYQHSLAHQRVKHAWLNLRILGRG